VEAGFAEGDLAWHALPFTTHTELMDGDLLDAATAVSARLDARFGKRTRCAKLTDVPGHTLGLVHNFAASTVNRSSVMDYPPPYVQLAPDGSPDLSQAYATGIGEWDKVSINFGYREFPAGTDETAALNNILADARGRGLRFLTDQDARPPGSSSSLAHLWDHGANAIDDRGQVAAWRGRRRASLHRVWLGNGFRDRPSNCFRRGWGCVRRRPARESWICRALVWGLPALV